MSDIREPTLEEASYYQGYIDGLATYAWWKDGVQYVGTTGTTLKEAIEKASEAWNYALRMELKR